MGRREKAALLALQMALPLAAGYAAAGSFGRQSRNIATAVRALSGAISAVLAEDGAPVVPVQAKRPGIRKAPKRAR